MIVYLLLLSNNVEFDGTELYRIIPVVEEYNDTGAD